MINANSDKAANAFEFIQYLCGHEGSLALAKAGLFPSYTDDDIVAAFEEAAGMSDMTALFDSDPFYEAAPVGYHSDVDTIWREVKELCLIGEMTLDEAIEDFETRRQPMLDANK